MCGIAGFTNVKQGLNAAQIGAQLSAMTDALTHRGPDGDGAWTSRDKHIALGHRRLSIIDLSAAGAQPMSSPCGRYVIVFNGEIYNYRDLKAALSAYNIPFKGTSDTEVLLAHVAQYGIEKTLPLLNGMFAFALWDKTQKTITLARDRIGQKPLYYSTLNGDLIFASELKSFKKHPNFLGHICRSAVSQFLRYGYIPDPLCIYKNVKKLPAGTYAVISCNSHTIDAVTPRPYWSARKTFTHGAENINPQNLDTEGLKNSLKEILSRSVARCMIADVPLGAFLSGGVDSSLITALMCEHTAQKINTYTIGFENPAYDESPYARDIAAHLGTHHTAFMVRGQDVLDVIPQIPQIYDEPFADMSQIPTFLLSKMTAQNVTVALSGDGADELFGGYTRYSIAQKIHLLTRNTPHTLNRIIGGLFNKTNMLPQKLKRLGYIMGRQTRADMYARLLTHYPWTSDLVLNNNGDPYIHDEHAVNNADLDHLTTMQLYDIEHYLTGDIFTKVDRAAMAVSLEVRAPFMDNTVIDFAATLPAHAKQNNGQNKWLLKQILHDYVPPTLSERPKKGFDIPLAALLRGDLKNWANALLSPENLHRGGILNVRRVRRIWTDHLSNRGDYHYLLWNILMLQLWLDNEPQP